MRDALTGLENGRHHVLLKVHAALFVTTRVSQGIVVSYEFLPDGFYYIVVTFTYGWYLDGQTTTTTSEAELRSPAVPWQPIAGIHPR